MRSVARREGREIADSLKDELIAGSEQASVTPFEKLMLKYAEQITRDAASIDRAYIDFLKGQEFDDRTIHDIAHVTAYFNYVNRLADALGVELES